MEGLKPLHLTVITPARSVFDGEATSVVVTAFDGELGVLAGHAPLMALLGPGPLRITQADGTRKTLAVRGGFLQVAHNAVTVLTPESVRPEELDGAKIGAEIEKLKAEPARTPELEEAKFQKLGWAYARRKVLEAGRGEHRN